MFLEPDRYEKLCDALPRPVHQQRPKPSTDALYHNPKGPVTSSITAVSGKRWAPCTSSSTNSTQHYPSTNLLAVLPNPPRLQEPASQAQSHRFVAQRRHVARLAPAAAAVRRSTDHAQDAPGALVPACPGQAATGAPCALATRASERRRAPCFLTTDVRAACCTEAFLAQFTV
jgi:hypothetical protein